jgi:hypothetical protein
LRSIEVPGTLSGSFDAMMALRAMLLDCSPACITQPMMTSSIWSGAAPERSTSASSTLAARVGRMPAGEAASLAAAGGARGGDDISLGRWCGLPEVVLCRLSGFKCRSAA